MNANQAFYVAIAVLLLQIINIQLQQMFAFFILYQRWANEYREMLNIAILRRRRHFRRVRNRPYTWTIPPPAESWFNIHYNDPTIPQEYFRQQLRVNRNTFETILHILGPRLERRNTRFMHRVIAAEVVKTHWERSRRIIIRKSSVHAKSTRVIITRFPPMKVENRLAMGQID